MVSLDLIYESGNFYVRRPMSTYAQLYTHVRTCLSKPTSNFPAYITTHLSYTYQLIAQETKVFGCLGIDYFIVH